MGSTSFLGVSCPNLLFVFLNLLHVFGRVLGLSLGLSILFYSVPNFGLICDHGNSFLCLEE